MKVCKSKKEKQKQEKLSDLQFVFTGSLEKYTRSEAQEKAESLGAKVTNSISSNVTHLVVGEEPGSKLEEANEEEEIEIIDEDVFLDLIGEV